MDFAKLDALLENSREDMIRTLRGWIAIPSVSARSDAAGAPFGAECRRALDLALADAKAMGFSVRDFDGYAGDITLEAGEKTLGHALPFGCGSRGRRLDKAAVWRRNRGGQNLRTRHHGR